MLWQTKCYRITTRMRITEQVLSEVEIIKMESVYYFYHTVKKVSVQPLPQVY